MAVKRSISFKSLTGVENTYDTATNFWTLASLSCPAPDPISEMVDVPGRANGPLDFSTVLTGDARYSSRELSITLESSEGTHAERETRINDLINRLHGRRLKVVLPDDADHYLLGRLSVKKEYNDLAHAAVTVTGICEPWRYSNVETQNTTALSGGETKSVVLSNDRRAICPIITVSGTITLTFGDGTYALTTGTYQLPEVQLVQGNNTVSVTGTGSIAFSYRKAVL